MSCKVLLIVVNDIGYFLSHRLAIALGAQQSGYTVHVAFGSDCAASLVADLPVGMVPHYIPLKRGGTNPIIDFLLIISLMRLFREVRPTIVHLVTIKPVLYGGIAARLVRIPAVVSAMAGLGYVFTQQNGVKSALIQYVVKPLFRCALGHPNQILIFQNHDDKDQILRIAPVDLGRVRLIPGSGIDLAKCRVVAEPTGVPIVAMASRLLRDKGVLEFVSASSILRDRGIAVQFWLIGGTDLANPSSLLPWRQH